MPFNPKNYPSNWKTEIRPSILKRAENKCEECGVVNGAPLPSGKFHVVLTVHHIDGKLVDHSEGNLTALCQKCHLAKHRQR